MKKLSLLFGLLVSATSLAYSAGDVMSGGDTSSIPPSSSNIDNQIGIYDMGGKLLIDRNVEVTGGVQADRYYDIVGISTPTAPPSGHARLYLSSSTYQYCAKFDNGTITCLGSGGAAGINFTTVQPILYSSTTGTFSLTPISLSTGVIGILPEANTLHTFASSMTFNGNVLLSSAVVTNLTANFSTFSVTAISSEVVTNLTVSNGFAIPNSITDIRASSNVACSGTNHNDATLFTNLDTATSGYILVTSTKCFINSNITIHNPLYFVPGAMLNGTGNLTLDSPPNAAPLKIFNNSGTVTITTATQPVFAEWWGASPSAAATTNSSIDSSNAFQLADNALVNGGTIRAQSGHYRMNSTVTFSHSNLIGDGRWNTVFEPGAAMVAYSSMTMFSLNNHYAHFESFQVNGLAISTFTVFLSSNAAGGERIRDIQMVNVGTGFNVPVNNAAHWSDVFINGCIYGVYSGNNHGLFAGDMYFNDFTIVPYNNGYGFVADTNSSAFYITNLTVLGGIGGFWEAISSFSNTGNDAKVSNMIFHHPLINAQSSFGLRIDAGLYTTLDDNPIINGISAGSAISVNPSTPTFVDGLEVDNALIDGNFNYGIDFAGCNLSVLGGNYLANGPAGIHIGANACGLVKLDSLMAGTTIWANAANGQSFGVQLDAGALNNKTDPISSNVFTGRLQMTNLLLGGNSNSPYQDNSTIANSRKLIANIQTDLGPNFSFGNNSTAGVFTSTVAIKNELLQGATYTIGQSGELARFRQASTQNLVITGAQGLSNGGSILSLNDNNTLAPLQLRGTQLYWAKADGNVGIGNTSPNSLLHVSSGNVTIDGSPSSLTNTFTITTGSAVINTELLVGTTFTLGQTREYFEGENGANQRLVFAGGQRNGTGGTILSLTDSNGLAPFQLRATEADFADGPVRATAFTDLNSNSIYGNFVASNTVTGGSSVTVNVSGYTGYVVRIFLNNATGAKASGILRINNNSTTNYSYSNQGWLLTVSSGISCGNTAASDIVLTGINSLGNGVNMSAKLDIAINSVSYYNGTTMYQESTGNNVANLNIAGAANITGVTSIQAWVGLVNSCTVATDPLTGTTGSIWVWGAY